MSEPRGQITMPNGRILPLRTARANPMSGACRMHLRRICGVCAAFSGTDIAEAGHCHAFDEVVSGRRAATKCEGWSRKMEGGAT